MFFWVKAILPLALLSTGCSAAELQSDQGAEGVLVRPNDASIGSISIGMTKPHLEQAGIRFESQTRFHEGDAYEVLQIELRGSTVSAVLGPEGEIHRLETTSPDVRDESGVGVGSSFEQVQEAYSEGRPVIEFADGKVANYITGTHLILTFDPDQLPASCFEHSERCGLDGLEVIQLAIDRYAPR